MVGKVRGSYHANMGSKQGPKTNLSASFTWEASFMPSPGSMEECSCPQPSWNLLDDRHQFFKSRSRVYEWLSTDNADLRASCGLSHRELLGVGGKCLHQATKKWIILHCNSFLTWQKPASERCSVFICNSGTCGFHYVPNQASAEPNHF